MTKVSLLLAGILLFQDKPAPQPEFRVPIPVPTQRFANCQDIGGSGNATGYHSATKLFRCGSEIVELGGTLEIDVEYGTEYRSELGTPSMETAPATQFDRKFWTWCRLNDRVIRMVDFNPHWKKASGVDMRRWYPNPDAYPDCKPTQPVTDVGIAK